MAEFLIFVSAVSSTETRREYKCFLLALVITQINFKSMQKKYFVLSGGGCRGFAHLGVVKALNEQGLFPEEIAGASAGALAGAFLANGFTPDEIKEIVLNKLKSKIFAWNGLKIGDLKKDSIHKKNIADSLMRLIQSPK